MCYSSVNAYHFVRCVNDEIICVNMLLDNMWGRYRYVNAHKYKDLHKY